VAHLNGEEHKSARLWGEGEQERQRSTGRRVQERQEEQKQQGNTGRHKCGPYRISRLKKLEHSSTAIEKKNA
jgi:hypothetical protein